MAVAPVPPGDRFALGRLLMTPGAQNALGEAGDNPFAFLARHAAGDWGEVGTEDTAENDRSLRAGRRLLSAYRTSRGERLWIITEADRSATTILLPGEY